MKFQQRRKQRHDRQTAFDCFNCYCKITRFLLRHKPSENLQANTIARRATEAEKSIQEFENKKTGFLDRLS